MKPSIYVNIRGFQLLWYACEGVLAFQAQASVVVGDLTAARGSLHT
jgi:hypothetical protein